jgi:hypothetical protein
MAILEWFVYRLYAQEIACSLVKWMMRIGLPWDSATGGAGCSTSDFEIAPNSGLSPIYITVWLKVALPKDFVNFTKPEKVLTLGDRRPDPFNGIRD